MSDSTNTATNLAQSWTTNAKAWIAAVRGGAIESRRLATDRAIVEAVLARHPKRVLDVGCGEGWLVHALTKHGIECVGVDGSPPLVKAAQAAGGGTFHVCSYADLIANLGHVEGGFGVVTVNFALLDAEIAPLLRSLRFRLAVGGALIVQTVHPWILGGAYRDGWRVEDFDSFAGVWQPMPWYFRTLGSWVGLLHESGYSVINLHEPKHPDTQAPLSLLFVAEPRES